MSEERDEDERLRSRFEAIVEGLELDLDDLEEPDSPAAQAPRRPAEPEQQPVEFDDLPDEQFYRNVDDVHLLPRSRSVTAAMVGLIGSPVLLILATTFGYLLPRPVTIAAILTFVASAIFLISKLPPSHGRGRWDGRDDGAEL